MSKNKSINELLSSIVSLINEAKNEYEFVINKDLPKNIYPEIEKIQILILSYKLIHPKKTNQKVFIAGKTLILKKQLKNLI